MTQRTFFGRMALLCSRKAISISIGRRNYGLTSCSVAVVGPIAVLRPYCTKILWRKCALVLAELGAVSPLVSLTRAFVGTLQCRHISSSAS